MIAPRPLIAACSLLFTVSVAVGAAEIRFAEVSDQWGLDFRHHHGGSGERYMVETVVGGVVLFDFDLDGDVDVFFVDGGRLPGYKGSEPKSRLFRNDGSGDFVDVTDRAKIVSPGYGSGATAGDIDSDGDLDLYITAFGPNRLLVNNGDGTFRDGTADAGVGDRRWSASAAFSDTDRDGDLDLYVTNYVAFDIASHKFCGNAETGLQGYCHPSAYEGVPDRFYRNRGDGSFEDATNAAGLAGADEAGLGVVFGDLDGDGWSDIYVANDADPNFLFRNRGDGTFEDVSLISGAAYSDSGTPEGSMGLALGDVDGDGRTDLLVANFDFEANALYLGGAGGLFSDHRFAANLAEPSLRSLAFGTVLADLDQDTDLDAVFANGHILDNATEFDSSSRYRQQNQVFENIGGGRFNELDDVGIDLVRATRGLAVGDLDGDGDLDVVAVNSNDLAEVYENVGALDRSSVLVDLAGARGNRFGIDARIALEADGTIQYREVVTGSSYLSQNAMSAHFGLGQALKVDRLEVSWPGGTKQQFGPLPAGKRLRVWQDQPGGPANSSP